jgi:hypothetical protein
VAAGISAVGQVEKPDSSRPLLVQVVRKLDRGRCLPAPLPAYENLYTLTGSWILREVGLSQQSRETFLQITARYRGATAIVLASSFHRGFEDCFSSGERDTRGAELLKKRRVNPGRLWLGTMRRIQLLFLFCYPLP